MSSEYFTFAGKPSIINATKATKQTYQKQKKYKKTEVK